MTATRPALRKTPSPAAPAPAEGFGGYAGSLALAGGKVIAAGFDGNLIALPAK